MSGFTYKYFTKKTQINKLTVETTNETKTDMSEPRYTFFDSNGKLTTGTEEEMVIAVQLEIEKDEEKRKESDRLSKIKKNHELISQIHLDLHKNKKLFNEELKSKIIEEANKCIEPSDIIETDFYAVMKSGLLDNISLNEPVDIDKVNKLLSKGFSVS